MKRVIWIALTVMSLIILASCGEENQNSEQSSEMSMIAESLTEESGEVSEIPEMPIVVESDTKESSVIEFSTNVEYIKPYQTLEECINDSQDIKTMIESISNEESSNTENSVLVEDDTKLVFERTLKENIIYSDTFVEDTEKALEEKREEFVEIVSLFEWGVDNDSITVVVRYKDTEGNIIFEKEFDNEE